jgi:hypothetical protein
MKRGLRPLFGLLLALLPLAAGAQSSVGEGGGAANVGTDGKAGDFGFVAGFNALYRVDLTNGAATVVGTGLGLVSGAPVSDLDSLAFAPDGTLYGVADSPQALYRVSTSTGRASLVAPFRENGNALANGLLDGAITFTCSGKLLLSSRSQRKLWEVDPATANATSIGSLAITVGGMGVLGEDLYALGVGSSVGLYKISPSTGASQRVAAAFSNQTIPGGSLAFAGDGRMYAVFDLYPPVERSVLAEISPVTGEVMGEFTLTGPQLGPGLDRRNVRALAIAPPLCAIQGPGQTGVQVPAGGLSSLVLLAIGLALLGALFVARRPA